MLLFIAWSVLQQSFSMDKTDTFSKLNKIMSVWDCYCLMVVKRLCSPDRVIIPDWQQPCHCYDPVQGNLVSAGGFLIIACCDQVLVETFSLSNLRGHRTAFHIVSLPITTFCLGRTGQSFQTIDLWFYIRFFI